MPEYAPREPNPYAVRSGAQVIHKVRVEIEYTVVSAAGFTGSVDRVEEKIGPVVQPDANPDTSRPHVRYAKIVSIGAARD
jgi:hypothetical protein